MEVVWPTAVGTQSKPQKRWSNSLMLYLVGNCVKFHWCSVSCSWNHHHMFASSCSGYLQLSTKHFKTYIVKTKLYCSLLRWVDWAQLGISVIASLVQSQSDGIWAGVTWRLSWVVRQWLEPLPWQLEQLWLARVLSLWHACSLYGQHGGFLML